jgi:hypothetical protein
MFTRAKLVKQLIFLLLLSSLVVGCNKPKPNPPYVPPPQYGLNETELGAAAGVLLKGGAVLEDFERALADLEEEIAGIKQGAQLQTFTYRRGSEDVAFEPENVPVMLDSLGEQNRILSEVYEMIRIRCDTLQRLTELEVGDFSQQRKAKAISQYRGHNPMSSVDFQYASADPSGLLDSGFRFKVSINEFAKSFRDIKGDAAGVALYSDYFKSTDPEQWAAYPEWYHSVPGSF